VVDNDARRIDHFRMETHRPLDDRGLVARIASGEEGAFVIAYDRHVHFVYGSVLRFLGDREATAEVVQDAFLALWRRAGQFDARAGSLLAWLLGIARNRAIDRLRAESRRPTRLALSLDAAADGSSEAADRSASLESGLDVSPDTAERLQPVPDPEVVAQRRWLQSVVRTALSELPETEQRALALAYGNGLSQAEIADRLGWPLGTVKSRTRRGMAHLRTRLAAVPGLIDGIEAMEGRGAAAGAGGSSGSRDRGER
jgi:RNA polymerase sigma-70 factor, ECF subfamily